MKYTFKKPEDVCELPDEGFLEYETGTCLSYTVELDDRKLPLYLQCDGGWIPREDIADLIEFLKTVLAESDTKE